MVVGNGLIAREFIEFQNDDTILFFASGVSNSKSTDTDAFSREINLLKEMLSKYKNSMFVYFSTTSIYDNSLIDSDYVKHKILIESIIKTYAKSYIVLRLSQVVGQGGNKTNLLNFLFDKIRNGERIDLWNKASRNIIDIEHVSRIAKHIIKDPSFINKTINIASSKNVFVYDLIKEIEHETKKKAILTLIDKGTDVYIDIKPILPILKQLNLNFENDYIKNLIRKYY